MEPTKEQVRTRLQGAIDTGQLQGIRSDGVNTNPRTQESARSVGSNLAASVSTINSNALKPTPVVNPPALPPNPTNTRINAATDISEAQAIPPKAPATSLQDKTQQFLQDQLGDGGRIDTQSVREELRLDEKRQRANDLDNKVIATKRRYEEQIEELEKNPEGKLKGNLTQEINKLTQEANKDLANLSFQYKIANDDLTGAIETYNARVADMKDYRDYQFQVNRAIEESLENDWTESEKEIFLNNEKIKADEIYFEQQKELVDYKASIDAMSGGGETPKIVKVNGVDSVFNSETGQFEPAPVSSSSDSLTPLGKLQKEEKILQVDSLINNSYLNNAVGTNRAARLSPASVFTAGKSDFVASVEQLVSSLSLTELQNAKAQGATFGALSNAEWKILGASATQIENWKEEKLIGKKTEGYQTSPAKFQAELDKINRFASMDYIIKGGLPEDIGLITTDDGNIWYENADETLTQLERTLD